MVKVLKERRSSSTDIHLQVKSLSEYEIYDWDAEKVVQALRNECKISKGDATKIAETVYNELVSMEKHEIDVQTLKMMVNYHLLKNGFNGAKLSGQVSVGMSLYDLDTLLHNKSSENSNISSNSPEALSLTVVENTFKKYALKKVFSNDIGNEHLNGLIHLHDLGQVPKIYALSVDTVVPVKINGEENNKSLMDIWDGFPDIEEEHLVDNHYEKKLDKVDIEILDRNKWVKVERLVIIREPKKMFEFELSDGTFTKVTEEHGCIVKRDGKSIITRADDVVKTDKFIKIL